MSYRGKVLELAARDGVVSHTELRCMLHRKDSGLRSLNSWWSWLWSLEERRCLVSRPWGRKLNVETLFTVKSRGNKGGPGQQERLIMEILGRRGRNMGGHWCKNLKSEAWEGRDVSETQSCCHCLRGEPTRTNWSDLRTVFPKSLVPLTGTAVSGAKDWKNVPFSDPWRSVV